MNGARQTWLVAVREMRERSRSRAFRASVVIMLLVVVAVIVLPTVIGSGGGTKDVGFTGSTPEGLATAVQAQGKAVGSTVRIHRYDTVDAGEEAVRTDHIDVLVADGTTLEWRKRVDEQLRAVVTGAIQLVAVQDRAARAGVDDSALAALLAPVPVHSIELGSVAGRTPDDETAAMVMTIVLFISISTYGALVLTGVVEEKASRVVEVLLARMPARNLLAGKVAGIGLLGLAQIAVTAAVALVAVSATDAADVPAVRGAVLAWVVVWFVLGYALYAMVYGALGSLASRTEDAQSVAGPATVVLVAGYFASFTALGEPDGVVAKIVSYFPVTAPMAMPSRIAMGATSWWEPLVAAALTLAVIAATAVIGGRVYTRAVLHSGPTMSLRAALRGMRSA